MHSCVAAVATCVPGCARRCLLRCLQLNKPIPLTKQSVDGIQLQGGTILGTSRGGANIK
jgi:hypothetical protein